MPERGPPVVTGVLRRVARPSRRVGPVALILRHLVATGVVAAVAFGGSAVGAAGREDRIPASARDYCRIEARINDLDVLSSTKPKRVAADLARLLALTGRAALVAPLAIHADAWAAVEAQQRFNDLYARNGWQPEPTNLDPDFVALADDPALAGVYLRLEQFQNRVCHARDGNPFIA